MHNLVPSRQHPGIIPTEAFSGKRQNISYLQVFGAKCWAKIPAAHGDSKLDPRSTECRLLGYALGSGNYKVQDVASCRVFISRDVVFEEGQPRRTSAGVREEMEHVFDIQSPPAAVTDNNHTPQSIQSSPVDHVPVTGNNHRDQTNVDHIGHDHVNPAK